MTEATTSPKQLLAELIDAYATAKMSGNETLVKLSLGSLQEFLSTHAIVSIPTEAEVLEEEAQG